MADDNEMNTEEARVDFDTNIMIGIMGAFVVVAFDKPTSFVGLKPDNVRELISSLNTALSDLEKRGNG